MKSFICTHLCDHCFGTFNGIWHPTWTVRVCRLCHRLRASPLTGEPITVTVYDDDWPEILLEDILDAQIILTKSVSLT